MKNQIIFLLFSILVLAGCDKSVTNPENNGDGSTANNKSELEKLFPANIGNTFTFSVDTMNLSTHGYDNVGSRLVSVDNKIVENGYDNFECAEEYDFLGIKQNSKYRITENSIDFFYDSTGVSKFIPDSIDVKLIFNEVFKVIQYPFADKAEWEVFKAIVNFGTFKFTILSISGQYVDEENLQLTGFANPIVAKKFKYTVKINIPDIQNSFVSKLQEYNAYVWLSPEIGLVKIEGCGMFINPISGRGFNIADSNKVFRQTLTSYN